MSRALEAQQMLYAADQRLSEVAQAFASTTDPEEIGMLQSAEALEEEAETLAAQAQASETPQQMAELLRQAEERAQAAEQQRRQAADTLLGRVGIARQAEQELKEAQGQAVEAVGGTMSGDEIVASIGAILAAADEVATDLAGAAELATDRGQQALGLIVMARDKSAEVAGHCHQMQQMITEYIGRL